MENHQHHVKPQQMRTLCSSLINTIHNRQQHIFLFFRQFGQTRFITQGHCPPITLALNRCTVPRRQPAFEHSTIWNQTKPEKKQLTVYRLKAWKDFAPEQIQKNPTPQSNKTARYIFSCYAPIIFLTVSFKTILLANKVCCSTI